MFQHFIITRFNLRREDWITTKNNDEVLSNIWLEERFELFDDFCFPSVKNQVNQNFKWLVFFDTSTPKKYRLKIEDYKLQFENFYPFFIDGMDSFLPEINEKIKKLNTKKYIITSRLDNDDCLHKNYVNTVQINFVERPYFAIDILDGYRMQIGSSVRIGKMKNIFNPYMSLIEKGDNFESVWHKGHTYWKYESRIVQIKNVRLWLTVIHEKNKANTFKGYGKVPINIINDFNIVPNRIAQLSDNFEPMESWRLHNYKSRWKILSSYYGKLFKRAIGFYRFKVLFEKNDYD